MRLFIAEKPELAKAITTGLSGTVQREDGYFKVGNDLVTWAYGHILGLAEPEDYDDKYKSWKVEDLPFNIDINSFKYIPKDSSKKQLNLIIDLISSKDIKTIVNAGDNDEEGQVLIDEILIYANNNKPVQRVLISDLTEKGVKKALQEIKSNDDFKGLSDSGFARSQADWLVGLNLTRAYTTLAQAQGYQGVLSVGRVQTPILGLVVARDKENESHQSSFYYTVKGNFNSNNINFIANLKVDERITNEDEANNILNICKGKDGVILKAINEPKRTNPPLPYNLLDLQAECSKKYSYKPDKTLEITQSLREKHKLITYNRSDCSYLPENLFSEAPATLESIKANLLDFEDFIDQANSSIKSLAWNDENVTAHHGIIPTAQKVNIKDLSKDELNVYTLIVRKFVAQFYEPKEYIHTQIEVDINNNIFTTSSKRTTKQGFEVLFKGEIEDDESEELGNNSNLLENITTNAKANCNNINISKEKTKPKPYYTMATLLKDLTSVAKYIKDPEIKKLLVEKDKDKKGENGGIGTPATRSNHLKTLFDRGYIIEDGKSIKSTETGKKIIELSPDSLQSPDMTALWFEQQKDIQNGNLTKEQFLNNVNEYIKKEIESLKEGNKFDSIASDENAIKCPNCEAGNLKRIKNKDNKFFWGCSNYQGGCKTAFPDDKGKPLILKPSGHKCPDCKDGDLIKRKTVKDKKTSYWWGCSNYSKGCKYTTFDEKGKPKKK
jgi:DNA topoisomerase III